MALILLLGAGATPVILTPTAAAASITNTRLDAWGTLELSGSSWLGGLGVDVYSNGATAAGPSPNAYNHVGGVQSGIKWQCVELINRLYLARGWISTTWWGDGNELYANAPANLAKQANGSITYINPGDVVTLDDGTHGHAGVVNSVSGSAVQIVNQNTAAVYSSAGMNGGTLTMSGWSGYTIQGVVHAPPDAPAGAATNARLVGDVNGDGRADAVVMFGATGTAKVALSTGSGFGYPGDWSYGHSVYASRYLLGDVNGDSKADLVAYYSSLRKWFVSISSGSGFWPPLEWSYDEPNFANPDRTYVSDVNGDGKADKIIAHVASGNWFVSLSSGSGFYALQSWIGGHGVGSAEQVVADFNGDGKTDSAVWVVSNGKWHVALSTGSSFGYPGEWAAAQGLSSQFRLVGDVSGDNRADVGYYGSNPYYKWWVGTSSGSGFWTPTEWSYDGSGYDGIENAFLADVDGDGKADKVLFHRATGNWYVAASSGSGFWPLGLWIQGHGANS